MNSAEGPDLAQADPARPAPPEADPADPAAQATQAAPPPAAPPRARARTGLGGRLFLLAMAIGLVVLALELAGKPIRLPVFLVAEIENRLNASLDDVLPRAELSVGGIEIVVGSDWVPLLRLEDLRLAQGGGPALIRLPDTELTIDPRPLLSGQLRARALRVTGASVTVRRDARGRLDLSFGAGQGPRIDSLGAAFAALDQAFASPALAGFRLLEADALSLTFHDATSGRSWQLGDGRLVFENRETELAGTLGLSLLGTGGGTAGAVVTVVAEKGRGAARISAAIDRMAAADLAVQSPVLGFLAPLEAPISGRIQATLEARGILGMTGQLDIGQGVLRLASASEPLAFDRVSLSLGYEPEAGRLRLGEIGVESPSLRLTARGQAYLVDGRGQTLSGPLDGREPAAFLAQLRFDRLDVDPAGLFAAPVSFTAGALEMRLRLSPLRLDLGQFALADGADRLVLTGHAAADAQGRLDAALDLRINQISRERLLALWPPRLVAPTRKWIETNLADARLTDIRGAFRQRPGAAPAFQLDYGFQDASFTFMKQMPPVTRADGYATIQGKTYTVVMDQGQVAAPQGGLLDMAGSVMRVQDILTKPAIADFAIRARGSLTATLAILDRPPFRFLTKAGRPVDLGQGQVETEAQVRLPLVAKVMPGDVTYAARARIDDFRSDQIVKGKVMAAARLQVLADNAGMTISGPALVGAVPVTLTYAQAFGPEAPPPEVTGTVELGPLAVKEFNIGLPQGAVTGRGLGQFRIALPRDQAPVMDLSSDLLGLTLKVPELAWAKPEARPGRFSARVILASPPRVPSLALSATGLSLEGRLSATPQGGLDRLEMARLTVGDWFEGAAALVGRGAGTAPAVEVTSGRFDLARLPADRGHSDATEAGGVVPLTVELDRLQVTDSLAIAPFRGAFELNGGLTGRFAGALNGQAALEGAVAPAAHGTAVRVTSQDAGAAARAAGLFSAAYGGELDMTLIPRPEAGQYDGKGTIRGVRVRYDSVLADLLNAISVVGLIEQLNGSGIAFDQAEGRFVLTPDRVRLQSASAIGASMGISMAGVYYADRAEVAMQGVISPIYLLNGIGAIFSRQGEGLFGFNYELTGKADDPQVSVNPLSILTPGMFREIFRAAPPVP